jgi:hypothetical protein
MNQALEQLASELGLTHPQNERLRLTFGHACARRIQHLLEQPRVMVCLDTLDQYLQGRVGHESLEHAQKEAAKLANQHQGSKSIDGCGHAAVSATYAVANAVNGKALQAASYAAYATVYASGGSAAVAEREAFEPEFSWQVGTLKAIVDHSCTQSVPGAA